MVKRITATVGGAFVAGVVYLFVWFFARGFFDTSDTAVQVFGHAIVVLIALAAGVSSYRASLARRQIPRRPTTALTHPPAPPVPD